MRYFAVLTAFLLLAPSVLAHDFWIEPSSFRPNVGAVLGVRLKVGENLLGDAVRRNSLRIERFVVVGPGGERPLVGNDGADPAGLARIETGGSHTIGYRSTAASLELEAGKFEQYLREEGLERVIAQRAARGESGKPGREIYSRCAKSLLVAGGVSGPGFSREIGLRLELVAENDPYQLDNGKQLGIRLLLDGKPVEGVLVVAIGRHAPARRILARTAKNGRVLLDLQHKGFWLIKAVHMIEAEDETIADWESLWASLTFDNSP